MKPYKLKHIPSGLYYQPHKHRGSNISERGKIYQTGTHGLSSAMKYAKKHKDSSSLQLFWLYVDKDSRTYNKLKDIVVFEDCRHSYNQVKASTKLTDWIIEEI